MASALWRRWYGGQYSIGGGLGRLCGEPKNSLSAQPAEPRTAKLRRGYSTASRPCVSGSLGPRDKTYSLGPFLNFRLHRWSVEQETEGKINGESWRNLLKGCALKVAIKGSAKIRP
jgi:hypothetical protein